MNVIIILVVIGVIIYRLMDWDDKRNEKTKAEETEAEETEAEETEAEETEVRGKKESIEADNRYEGHILTDEQLKEIEVFYSKLINLDGVCKSTIPAIPQYYIYDTDEDARNAKDLDKHFIKKDFSNPFSNFKESDHNTGANEQQMEKLKKEFKSKADDVNKEVLDYVQFKLYKKILNHNLIVETARNKEGYKCNQGLTLAKVLRAIQHLDNNKVPKDGRYAMVNFKQWRDLLQEPSFEEIDEKDGKKDWLGVTWIRSDNITKCFMYHKDYLKYTITKPLYSSTTFYDVNMFYSQESNEREKYFGLLYTGLDLPIEININSKGFVKMPCSTNCSCC